MFKLLDSDTKIINGKTYYRIQYTSSNSDFNYKSGDLGGYVTKSTLFGDPENIFIDMDSTVDCNVIYYNTRIYASNIENGGEIGDSSISESVLSGEVNIAESHLNYVKIDNTTDLDTSISDCCINSSKLYDFFNISDCNLFNFEIIGSKNRDSDQFYSDIYIEPEISKFKITLKSNKDIIVFKDFELDNIDFLYYIKPVKNIFRNHSFYDPNNEYFKNPKFKKYLDFFNLL